MREKHDSNHTFETVGTGQSLAPDPAARTRLPVGVRGLAAHLSS